MNGKLNESDKQNKSAFLNRLSNFWYHNKTKVVAIAFMLFVIVISIMQMCSQEAEDVTLVYGGPRIMTAAEFEGVRAVFGAVMPEDYNNDGKKYAKVISYSIMTEQQQKEYGAEAGGINSAFYAKEYENYTNMLLTGEYSLYLVDPWLFENLVRQERLQKVSDVVPGADSVKGFSEYGVRLGDTSLYIRYDALGVLPEDTVICLLKPYVYGASSKTGNYEISKQMFAALIEYE